MISFVPEEDSVIPFRSEQNALLIVRGGPPILGAKHQPSLSRGLTVKP